MRKLFIIAVGVILVAALTYIVMAALQNSRIPVVPISTQCMQSINSTGIKALCSLTEDSESSVNICIFNLPLVQCMVSSNRFGTLRGKYGLPNSIEERKTLFDNVSALNEAYEKNWSRGFLKSEFYLIEGLAGGDSLFAGIRGIEYLKDDALRRLLGSAGFNSNGTNVVSYIESIFRSSWESKFQNPRKEIFIVDKETKVLCDFMQNNGPVIGAVKQEYSAAFVPFSQFGAGILFIMPGTGSDVTSLSKELSGASFFSRFDFCQFSETNISIPVLDFTSRICLKGDLDNLPFSEFLAQKSCLTLDSEGVIITTNTFHGDSEILTLPEHIVFNRPFLFFVLDNINKVVLYSCAIRNPME